MSPEATYVLQSLATVAVFGGALWIAAWGVRRIGVNGRSGPLEILARQPLDGRRAIYLVRVGKRVLVIGATDSALTRLSSTSLESLKLDELSEKQAPKSRFGEVLSRVLGPRAPK
jgi:flagellar biogenesis protein FliO